MDELYVIEKLWPQAKALATSVSEKDGKTYPVAWINQYGKARVFGTTYGHSDDTFRDPVFLGYLSRGVLWAAGRLQEIAGGDFKRSGKAENHVSVEAELAALVVGDQRLNHARSLGELDLGKAALTAKAGQSLTGSFIAERQGRPRKFGRLRHDGS